jgi:hypothetical protein
MPASEEFFTDGELEELEEVLEGITPGPWYWALYDDVDSMELIAVTTDKDKTAGDNWPDFDAGTLVAATLVQAPRYVDVSDQRWQQNVQFIARCRTDVPNLIREVRRLRTLLADKNL